MPENSSLIDAAADQLKLVERRLRPDEKIWLTLRSGSMLPTMPVGARIAVQPVDGSRCRVGDVVVFRQGDRLVAHRLIFGWGAGPASWFLQRGDGVSGAGLLRSEAILGRVVAVQRPHAAVETLTGEDAGWRARRAARRSLARFLRSLVTGPLRKARGWLTRGSTGSA